MGIVVALDVHRNQITYKALDRETAELRRGRIAPATRAEVRAWLGQFAGCDVEFALEGTTGWRFVVEEIERAGHRAHLADPAETAAKRGRKRRAKTDNADCDLQLRLLLAGELPESWIPPAHILELRTRVRTRKLLIDQRTAWQQRLQAQLFHQGVAPGLKPRTRAGRAALAEADLSPAARELVALAPRTIDTRRRHPAPPPARSGRGGARPRANASHTPRRRSKLPPKHATTARGRPSARRCFAAGSRTEPAARPRQPGRPLKTERSQAPPRRDHTPSIILSPDDPRPCTQVRLGAPRRKSHTTRRRGEAMD